MLLRKAEQIQIYDESVTSGHSGTLAKMLGTVTTPPELFLANAKVWLLPWPQREGSLIGNVKQSAAACCQCCMYSWQWQLGCVWLSLRRATMTRRAESRRLWRQVCCDPASHREIRLTLPPALLFSACQKLVCPLWTRSTSSSRLFLWGGWRSVFTKLLLGAPKWSNYCIYIE